MRKNRGLDKTKNLTAGMLAVPGGLKYLDADGIKALSDSFRDWLEAASKPHIRISRSRIWLVFLLLRHTGAKLGEILALDPTRDLDKSSNVVRIGAGEGRNPGHGREVPVPAQVMREISGILADPRIAEGAVFDLDPGYVRRKFYERAEEAGLSRRLASPSVIRNSRAVEMLQAGTPLAVIQNVLGHSNLGPTAQYFELSEENLGRLKKYYAQKELTRKTSARNAFIGEVTRVLTGPVMCEVELTTQQGGLISAVITNESRRNLGLEPSSLVTATIKAPLVDLAKMDGTPRTSARNSFPGTILEIKDDSTVAEVVVEVDEQTQLCALISSQSVRKMGLVKGDKVVAFFKALAVVLAID